MDFSRDILPAVIGERSIVAYPHTSVRMRMSKGGCGVGVMGRACDTLPAPSSPQNIRVVLPWTERAWLHAARGLTMFDQL